MLLTEKNLFKINSLNKELHSKTNPLITLTNKERSNVPNRNTLYSDHHHRNRPNGSLFIDPTRKMVYCYSTVWNWTTRLLKDSIF